MEAMISSVRGGSAGKWRPLFDGRRLAWPADAGIGERREAGESSGGEVGMTPPADERDEATLTYHCRRERTRRDRNRREAAHRGVGVTRATGGGRASRVWR